MSAFTIYHLCKESIEQQQPVWANTIIQSANPDMIFLLGASLHRRRSESIFQNTAPSSKHVGDFFFLILISELGNKTLQDWQDKIEANCRHLGAGSVWVLSTKSFHEWLKQGHFFAMQVWQKAVRLHDKGIITDASVSSCSAPVDETETEKNQVAGKNRAKEFLVGAELFVARKQYSMAAFMLHQCAEQTLITLVKARTGYHANTHSIERLLRLAELVSYQIRDMLPRTTEKQKCLFSQLQKAYIEARYKADYKATEEDLQYLLPKVKDIVELLE